jgi:hypothetical protein
MPYQNEDYTPPQLPDVLSNLRTLEDCRSAIGKIMEYLQRMQANNVQFFSQLIQNVNQAATTQGPDIVSAPTITVTKFMHVVTGTATVTTILAPKYFAGQLMLFSQDGFYLATGGNISMFTSPNFLQPGAHIMLTYVPSKSLWYTDSCRLQNTTTSLLVGGHTVVTE